MSGMNYKKKHGKASIHDEYRRILGKPELADKEIDEMRVNVQSLARTICEHVWKEKFY